MTESATVASVPKRVSTARSSISVAAWTLISRLIGLLRVLVIGALMGPTYFANIFQAGYMVPNMIQAVIAGPILGTVVVPTVVRALDNHGTHRAAEVLSRISGRMLTFSVAGALLLALLSPVVAWTFTVDVPGPERMRAWQLAALLVLFVAPQIVGYGIVSLCIAAQQARGRFALAAGAPGVESVGIMVTLVIVSRIYGTGVEVNRAPTSMMIMLGVGTTASLAVHLGLQIYGTRKVGLLRLPSRGWRDDPEAADALLRILRSVPIAVCPSTISYLLTALASTVPGGVWVIQLSYQMYYSLSFLGSRAVSLAALPRLAKAASGSLRQFGAAWREGIFYAVSASLPSMCLLAVFAAPTADLLANGELRRAGMIGVLASSLTVAAFAQMAGGIHDFGRQGLFARFDDRGPRIASVVGLPVSAVVAFSTLFMPANGFRLAGLVTAILAGETASAAIVLIRLRWAIRPEAFTERAHVLAAGLATLAMSPVIAAGWFLLHNTTLRFERISELAVLVGCGALALAMFAVVLRRTGPNQRAEQP